MKTFPMPKLRLKVGQRVTVGLRGDTVGVITAINKDNRSFPYEVEWDSPNGKYRTDCMHQLRAVDGN